MRPDMVAVDQACQLMKQALAILDAEGAHQSAAMLDSAIHLLPEGVHADGLNDGLDCDFGSGETSSQP